MSKSITKTMALMETLSIFVFMVSDNNQKRLDFQVGLGHFDRVKKHLLILFYLCLYAFSPVFAENIELEKGDMAVCIDVKPMPERMEFSRANLINCLTNHLDYYLWYRGWSFRFIQPDSDAGIDRLIEQTSYSRYRYLLYLDCDASFDEDKLTLKLKISLVDLKNGEKLPDKKSFKSKSRSDWIDIPAEIPAGSKFISYEPPDYVVKRMLSEALAFLPAYERESYSLVTDLPVNLVIDQKMRQDSTTYDSDMLIAALEYVSSKLRKQAGVGIKLCDVEYIHAKSISFDEIQPLFKSLMISLPKRKDTVTIGIFEPDEPVRFYQVGFADQIGLSDLARGDILIASLSPPNQETLEWKAFQNGHSILHEIGHMLGAMHVSDLNSIMNTHTTWVGATEFDRLNSLVITSYLKNGRSKNSVASYLEFLADAIEQTGYKQSDFPAFFDGYMEINQLTTGNLKFEADGFGESINYAIDGYRQLLEKNPDSAKSCFYRALVYDSTQGATHYYMSKATSGPLSELHLKKAAELGFYKAIFELVRKHFE
jgi:hypothetical protein